MDLEKLYQLAEREGLNIYNCHIPSVNGCYIKYDKYKVIGLNYSKLNKIVIFKNLKFNSSNIKITIGRHMEDNK